MKRLEFIVLVPIVLTLASCKPELIDKRVPESVAALAPVSGILHDTAFKELIRSQVAFYKGITNPEGIREVLRDEKISADEYRNYPLYFGFPNRLDFERHFLLLKYRAKWLDERYGWKSLPVSTQLGYLTEGIKWALGITAADIGLMLADRCQSEKQACLSASVVKAAAMHIACAAVDITILAGLACHGAAVLIQMAESDKCSDAYDACKRQVIQQSE